jgi:protein PsiE
MGTMGGCRDGATQVARDRSKRYRSAGGQSMPLSRSKFSVSKAIHFIENAFLFLIAVFTAIGMFQEIYLIIDKRTVALQDLLLMFIYVEVLAMVGAYYDSKQIPITLPLFIAITAIARLTILQGKEQPPINLILEAGAILILALASVVVTYRSPRGDGARSGE